jgi:protein-disulfide isomerase
MNSKAAQTTGASRLRMLLDIAIIALMAVVALWLLISVATARRGHVVLPEPLPPTEPVGLDGAALKGDRAAKVAVIVYSDFLCPACGKFARETLPLIDGQYVTTGKVLLAFRHFPIASPHLLAFKAAEAATCAGRQGKFWEMHDLLFQNQPPRDEDTLRQLANRVVSNPEAFAQCLNGQASRDVQLDAGGGLALGFSATPTLLIGTVQADGRVKVSRLVSGAIPASALADVVAHLLAEKRSTN